MIERKMMLVITFSTTFKAMKMEKICEKHHAPGRLIPVPRTITSGCGLAWCAKLDDRKSLEDLIQKEEIHIEGIYECLV